MKKVLVVDDDPDIVEFVTELLKAHHYEVASAENGRQGVEKARQYRPDLVILDLMMPDMHGFEVCQALREDPQLKDIRIIVSSGKRYQTDHRAADRLGADRFVAKPYKVADMMGAVAALIGRPEDPLPALTKAPEPGRS
ncbi:MAG TPA: response regulator [Elusimicrobiota bacterium]|nr:response regulator [Elusimicrobiota bacterium]